MAAFAVALIRPAGIWLFAKGSPLVGSLIDPAGYELRSPLRCAWVIVFCARIESVKFLSPL